MQSRACKTYKTACELTEPYRDWSDCPRPQTNYFSTNTLEGNRAIRKNINIIIFKLRAWQIIVMQESGTADNAIAKKIKLMKDIKSYLALQIRHQEDPISNPAPATRIFRGRAIF